MKHIIATNSFQFKNYYIKLNSITGEIQEHYSKSNLMAYIRLVDLKHFLTRIAPLSTHHMNIR